MSFYLESDIEEICSNLEEDFKSLENKTIFFAGIAGFLGRYFAESVNYFNKKHNANIKLIGADNFVSSGVLGKNIKKYDKNWFEFIDLDLAKKDIILPSTKIDFVIHAAGIASPAQYKARPIETFDVAINGSKLLLDFAEKNSSRYTFFSSSEIYGDPDENNIPINEDYKGYVSSIGPRSCYDESKRAGETLSYIYHEYNNLETNIIRPFNVYGPGMQKTDYRVMPNFTYNALEGKKLQVYGSGLQTRTYCYITDAISGFWKVIIKGIPGDAYNIGNPQPEISVNELAKKFKDIYHKEINIKIDDYPENYPEDEPNRRCPSIEKAKKDLGYNPNIGIDEGIERLLNWAKNI
tara:strand:- start:9191 stop:10243 length:1053 start_codon:yes stop_codon:yes gene_type:complete